MSLDRFLITGADGVIGQAISFGIRLSHSRLDVMNYPEMLEKAKALRATGIIHLAALGLSDCEARPEAAFDLNVQGTRNVAQLAAKRQIPLVYVSSGAIFSGARGQVFTETSVPRPLNVYGRTKFAGERIVQELLEHYLIVRTGWVFGETVEGKRKSVDVVVESIRRGIPIHANQNQDGSPTYVKDLVEKTRHLLETGFHGIYHVVNSEPATAWALAHEVSRITRADTSIILPLPTAPKGPVPERSPSEVLDTEFEKMRPWRVALEEYLAI